jgi:hypothetical protein
MEQFVVKDGSKISGIEKSRTRNTDRMSSKQPLPHLQLKRYFV